MKFLMVSSEYLFLVIFHINQLKSDPQTNSRPSEKEVPQQLDCTVRFRPSMAVAGVGTRQKDTPVADSEGCECIPYYLCNSNRTADAGVAILTGVGLVSSPPYKSCPCAQASSSPKPNNAGICPNYLDICCTPQKQVLSDELPDQPSSWNGNLPGNFYPWQNSPEHSHPWHNEPSGSRPPWNNKSPGNFPPWNNKIPGNSPPWNFKPTENKTSWNNNKPENLTPWNNNVPGRPPIKPPVSDDFPPWRGKYPACSSYLSNFQNNGGLEQYTHFPWMVAIFGEKIINGGSKRNSFLCGGSLINPDIVLTAAHCVKGKKSLTIQAGKRNPEGGDRQLSVEEKLVHHVKVHEEYYAGALYNDIALLFLETPLEVGPDIGTVCLPEPGARLNLRDCFVSGWGAKAFGESENYGGVLKKIGLSIVPRGFCEEILQTTRLGRYFHLHESFICAKGKGDQDACTGDGGGPLLCPSLDRSDTYVQVGVVSWGIGCGSDIPGVYVNVSYFRSWIGMEMATLNVDERFRI